MIRRIPVRARPMVLAPLAFALGLTPALTIAADPVAEAIRDGKAHMQTRLRHEEVSVDNSVNDDATALTLRTRLGYTTGTLAGLSGMLEFEDVRTVADTDEYAPVQNGYEFIADPPVTELNQAYMNFDSGAGLSLRYGRQRIILDNARFVGNVGWRQDEQTFDATRADYDHEHLHATLAWITAVNGITPAFDANVSTGLANLKWKTAPGGTLTGYGYLIESDTSDRELNTLGARYNGDIELDPVTLLLTLEAATQERDNPGATDPEADYRLIEVGAAWKGVTLKAAREILGSDDGTYGFETPLATKHAFNGWADQFLSTPSAGLVDDFVTVAGDISGISLKAVYHDFSADEGSTDFGDELDLLASRDFGEHYTLGIKHAGYDAGTDAANPRNDTDKFWVWGEFRF